MKWNNKDLQRLTFTEVLLKPKNVTNRSDFTGVKGQLLECELCTKASQPINNRGNYPVSSL